MREFWRRRGLERELRRSRPAPRAEFVSGLLARVEEERVASRRSSSVRLVFAMALMVGMLTAFAAVGGIGYASDMVQEAGDVVLDNQQDGKDTPADDQYGEDKDGEVPTDQKDKDVDVIDEQKGDDDHQHDKNGDVVIIDEDDNTHDDGLVHDVVAAELPFTGLPLWIVLALAIPLIGSGLALRKRN